MTGEQAEKQALSQKISEVTELFRGALRDYNWSEAEVKRMEGLTQDYLHKLELEHLTVYEQATIAQELSKVRQERRRHKDEKEMLEPLVEILRSTEGVKFTKALNDALGKTRKVERRQETRTYAPRELGWEEADHGTGD